MKAMTKQANSNTYVMCFNGSCEVACPSEDSRLSIKFFLILIDIVLTQYRPSSSDVAGLEHHMQLSSVCPLETLHNSLSLKQIDEFFGRISQHYMRTMDFSFRQSSPASKKYAQREVSDYSGYSRSASNPSSNVSSAWPSPENTRHTFDLTKIMTKLQVLFTVCTFHSRQGR